MLGVDTEAPRSLTKTPDGYRTCGLHAGFQGVTLGAGHALGPKLGTVEYLEGQ